MRKIPIGTVRYVEDYIEAPPQAKYIVRQCANSVVFEKYFYRRNGTYDSKLLKEFDITTYQYPRLFKEMLRECRLIVKSSYCIWVERPNWKL